MELGVLARSAPEISPEAAPEVSPETAMLGTELPYHAQLLNATTPEKQRDFWGWPQDRVPGDHKDEFRFFAKEDLAASGLLPTERPSERKPLVHNFVDFGVCDRWVKSADCGWRTGGSLGMPLRMQEALVRMLEGRQQRELHATALLLWRMATVEAKHAGAIGSLEQENAKLKLKMRNVVNFLSVRL